MKNLLKIAIPLLALTNTSLYGALTVNITGVLGSGQTAWEFSGSYDTTFTNENDGILSFNVHQLRDSRLNSFSHTLGDLSGEYTEDSAHNSDGYSVLSGNATVSGSVSGIHNIDGLFIDSDGSTGSDDFAWYADGIFSAPQTLTFQGVAVIATDIGTFGEGSTLIQNHGDNFSVNSTSEITPLTMTFTAIPEPTSVTLLGISSLGICLLRRRSKRS